MHDKTQGLGYHPPMPTVLNVNGYRFYIWPKDHLPPHVHVYKGGDLALVMIETLEVRRVEGMGRKDLRQVLELTAEHKAALLAAWREIHG